MMEKEEADIHLKGRANHASRQTYALTDKRLDSSTGNRSSGEQAAACGHALLYRE